MKMTDWGSLYFFRIVSFLSLVYESLYVNIHESYSLLSLPGNQ